MNVDAFRFIDIELINMVKHDERALRFLDKHVKNRCLFYTIVVDLNNATSLKYAMTKYPPAFYLDLARNVTTGPVRVEVAELLASYLNTKFSRFFTELIHHSVFAGSLLSILCNDLEDKFNEMVTLYLLCKKYAIEKQMLSHISAHNFKRIAEFEGNANLQDCNKKTVLMRCLSCGISLPNLEHINLDLEDSSGNNVAHYYVAQEMQKGLEDEEYPIFETLPIQIAKSAKQMQHFTELFFRPNKQFETPFMQITNVKTQLGQVLKTICEANWNREVGPRHPTVICHYYQWLIHYMEGIEPKVTVTENDDYLPLHALIQNPNFALYCHHKVTQIGINKQTRGGEYPVTLYAANHESDSDGAVLNHLLQLTPQRIPQWNVLQNITTLSACFLIVDKRPDLCSLQEVIMFLHARYDIESDEDDNSFIVALPSSDDEQSFQSTRIQYKPSGTIESILVVSEEDILIAAESSYNIQCWFTHPNCDSILILHYMCKHQPSLLLRSTVLSCPADTLQQLLPLQDNQGNTAIHMLAAQVQGHTREYASKVIERWCKTCEMSTLFPLRNAQGTTVSRAIEAFADTTQDKKLKTMVKQMQNKATAKQQPTKVQKIK